MPGAIYPVALVLSVGLVSWTGYRGGQLSLGENHLTEFMPAPLRGLLGVSDRPLDFVTYPNPGPGTFYAARVQPLFNDHCISCHGAAKEKSESPASTAWPL